MNIVNTEQNRTQLSRWSILKLYYSKQTENINAFMVRNQKKVIAL